MKLVMEQLFTGKLLTAEAYFLIFAFGFVCGLAAMW